MLRSLLKLVAIILFAGLIAVALEGFYFNRHALKAKDHPAQPTLEELAAAADGFSLQDGALVSVNDQATIHLQDLDRYIRQVVLTYESETTAEYYLQVEPMVQDQPVKHDFTDRYQAEMVTSATVINQDVRDLTIVVPDAGLRITGIELDNHFNFNWLRVIFFWVVAALLLALLLLEINFDLQIEYLFLSVGLLLGLLLILLLPQSPVGWDEQIHFRTIILNSYHEEAMLTPAAERFANLEIPQPDSRLEQIAIRDWLNGLDDVSLAEPVITESPWHLDQAPYALYSLVLWLARLLGTTFTTAILAARISGLAMYLLITALVIRFMPYGKNLLAVYALMPTLIFQASSLTYDNLTNAAAFLLFALILAELANPELILTRGRFALIVVAAVLMTSAKGVYVPLVALAYLFPSTKFLSEKKRLLFLIAVTLLILWIAASFILPTATHPSLTGDLRVEGTSIAGQLDFMLTHPASSFKMIFSSIFSNLGSYFLANTAILSYAYAGTLASTNLSMLAILVLFFAAITDTGDRNTYFRPLQHHEKAASAVIILLTIVLVWTALYLSFTTVGAGQVDGVQPRYYFPLAIPFLLLLHSKRIGHNFPQATYLKLTFVPVILINLYGLYTMFLLPFNL